MATIASRVSVGARFHDVTLQTAGAAVPDGQGGFTTTATTLAARLPAEIKPATARELERVIANTVQSSASHLVTIPFVNGVTLTTQLIFHDPLKGDRTFSIAGIHDPDERHVELVLACEEVVQ